MILFDSFHVPCDSGGLLHNGGNAFYYAFSYDSRVASPPSMALSCKNTLPIVAMSAEIKGMPRTMLQSNNYFSVTVASSLSPMRASISHPGEASHNGTSACQIWKISAA
jgi:hypothetical protein